MFLENQSIRLRALEPEDIDTLYQWENNSDHWKYNEATEPLSRYIIKQYIAHSNVTIYEKKELRLMIVLKSNNKLIGCIDLLHFDPFHSRAGIGILITSEYTLSGYAFQALELIIDYSFKYLLLRQVYAHIGIDNQASKALFSKANFIHTATLKEWQRIDQDWKDVLIYQKQNTKL